MSEESNLKGSNTQSLLASRRNMFLGLIFSSIVCSALIFFAPVNGDRLVYSDILAVITSGAAFLLCVQVVYRHKMKGMFGPLYASLGVALGLWFVAECIWSYYEVGLGIETPFPSIADAFWLAGYVPLSIFLVGILKNFLGIRRSKSIPMSIPMLTMLSVGFVTLGVILLLIYEAADLSSQAGITEYLVGSAYPVADMFLIIPSIIAFTRLREGMLTFAPWAFIVTAILVITIADIGFAYTTLADGTESMVWVWNPLFNAGYIAFASSLLWHKQFFTVDEKKLTKTWQEENR